MFEVVSNILILILVIVALQNDGKYFGTFLAMQRSGFRV